MLFDAIWCYLLPAATCCYLLLFADICCDVLDTYFTFLRASVMLGNLALEQEQEIVLETKQWLESKVSEKPVYQRYLSHWGDWKNPWDPS